jgi:hypothetical protein
MTRLGAMGRFGAMLRPGVARRVAASGRAAAVPPVSAMRPVAAMPRTAAALRLGAGPRLLAVLGLAGALAGCAARMLPYVPAQQPAGFPISADYQVVGERLRVAIDTSGHRLEDVQVVRGDGTAVAPITLEPAGSRVGGPGLGIGLGVGSVGRSGSVSIGTGLGVGTAVGGGGRYARAEFPLELIGSAPWRLRVKVVGVQPTEIVLGPPR